MSTRKRFYIVDDNLALASTAKALLEAAGHEVTVQQSSVHGLAEIPGLKPDAVMLDIMMPEMDGIELCGRLRKLSELDAMKIIMLSGKAYDFDRRRAFEVGADGYIFKPVKPKTFVEQVMAILADEAEIRYWGVRGTLPRSGPDALRYGGNTNCVTFKFPRAPLFICDAGTGIKRLADHLLAGGSKRIEGKIFISHPHWDHINALPFFSPLYIPGNEFEILGASHGDISVQKLVSAQMEGVFFPITVREFGAALTYRDLHEGSYDVAGVKVDTMLLSHPGHCLGYRFNYRDRSACYITDNELFLPESEFHSDYYVEQLANFVRGTEILITDCTYMDAEYRTKVGWGHSSVSQVVDMAHRGEVKALHLFHHDPDQNDAAIDIKLDVARKALEALGSKTVCVAPAEGDRVVF